MAAAVTEATRRRVILLTAVVGYAVLGLVHGPDITVGDDATFYIWLHIFQPVLILLLAWGFWLLVKDLPGRAAQVARLAIVPYVIAYTTLDAIAGIATGMMIEEANQLGAADAAVVKSILDSPGTFVEGLSIGIFVAAGLSWFVVASATAVALKPIGGLGPTVLMVIGAAVFAFGHPFPPGPIGIGLFGVGIAWLELRRQEAAAPQTEPALVP
jgi:hypothetical protein